MSTEPPAIDEEWQEGKAEEESKPQEPKGSKQGKGGRRNKGSEQWKWKEKGSDEWKKTQTCRFWVDGKCKGRK